MTKSSRAMKGMMFAFLAVRPFPLAVRASPQAP